MSRPRTRAARRRGSPLLIYGVTVGVSAFALMRGQLRWFAANGWDVMLACSPDREANLTVEREGVAFHGIPTKKDVSPIADVRSLVVWIRFLHQQRSDAVNVGTPKAGLLGGLAAWLTRVPKRIYVVRGLRLEGTRGTLRAVLWLMERLSAAVAKDVVVVSHSLARELLAHRLVSPKKSWLIGAGSSNGVDAGTIPWAISKGLDETGVTMFKLDGGVDSGPTIAQQVIPIGANETATTLYEKVNEAHRMLMVSVWPSVVTGEIHLEQQNEMLATEWTGRRPEDGRILKEMSTQEVDRLVRATTRPYPGALTDVASQTRLRVWAGSTEEPHRDATYPLRVDDGVYFSTDLDYEELE